MFKRLYLQHVTTLSLKPNERLLLMLSSEEQNKTNISFSGLTTRVDRNSRGLHQTRARLQARHHLHRGPEAPPHQVSFQNKHKSLFFILKTCDIGLIFLQTFD